MIHQLIGIPIAILLVVLHPVPSLHGNSGGERFGFYFLLSTWAGTHTLNISLVGLIDVRFWTSFLAKMTANDSRLWENQRKSSQRAFFSRRQSLI